jgi:NAD(P)-dependent dehydrogenase (short-subunit alcohol dehydrogenase family)
LNILLTGADRGLGFGTAKFLLEQGHAVYAGQYLAGWSELAELRASFPESLFLIPLDISSSQSVEAAYALVREQTGLLDMIVNNAGISGHVIPGSDTVLPPVPENPAPATVPASPEEGLHQDFERMLRVYNTNALGAIRVVETFLPLMKHSRIRRLCFVSSEAGSVERSERTDMFGYCMSKASLNMYVKILFNRLHPAGYDFRLYHPGWVKSYMRGFKSDAGDLEIEEAGRLAAAFYLSGDMDMHELKLVDYKGNVWPF